MATPSSSITVIEAHVRDVAGLPVRRVLPAGLRRMVGPFAFFDHMGPVALERGLGIDVPPHPHIGLSTVTYLFEGELLHRDSVGSRQLIRPGDVNWMTAGRGIVHSERTPDALRVVPFRMHGLQLWVALPQESEETEPSFQHHPADTLPILNIDGAMVRILAGSAFGMTAPVRTHSALFYADAVLGGGRSLLLGDEHEERAAYVVEGSVICGEVEGVVGHMLAFASGARVELHAPEPARVMLIGGAAFAERRYIDWNFVSSSRERIELAKADWKQGRFAKVPGDELEFMPLPE